MTHQRIETYVDKNGRVIPAHIRSNKPVPPPVVLGQEQFKKLLSDVLDGNVVDSDDFENDDATSDLF